MTYLMRWYHMLRPPHKGVKFCFVVSSIDVMLITKIFIVGDFSAIIFIERIYPTLLLFPTTDISI